MIRTVVLPFGRGGIIGGTMLGLGRALGETIAVLLIISPTFDIKFRTLENGTSTISSLIAEPLRRRHHVQLSALLTAGFVLFVMTWSSTPSPPSSSPAAAAAPRRRSEHDDDHDRRRPGPPESSRPGSRPPTVAGDAGAAATVPRRSPCTTVDDRLVASSGRAGRLARAGLAAVYEQILPVQRRVGFFVCWYLAFLALYARRDGARATRARSSSTGSSSAVVTGAAVLVGVALASAVIYTSSRAGRPCTT